MARIIGNKIRINFRIEKAVVWFKSKQAEGEFARCPIVASVALKPGLFMGMRFSWDIGQGT